jgi:hypothetical protein
MDPYLEGSLWTTIHSQLGAEIARQLAPKLSDRYLALTTEQVYYDFPDGVGISTRSLIPDVGILDSGGVAANRGSVAVAPPPLQAATIMPVPIPHVRAEIRDRASRELVTAIELLSPTNKRGQGREEYIAKRWRLMLSLAHLVEIDLLHHGQRIPMHQPLPAAPYFAFVGRVEKRPILDIWPIQVQDSLPAIPIPLLSGDADVTLDLELALTTVYDVLHYERAIDYGQPPEIELPPEETGWLDNLLRTAKLRS